MLKLIFALLLLSTPALADVDPLSTWQSTLAALPKVSTNSWASNFASWYAGRIVAIKPSTSALTASGFLFTFPTAAFASQLQSLPQTTSQLSGIQGFANAWAVAIASTVVFCAPGTFKPPTTPATLFSVVATTTIDTASITAGKNKILELATSPPVSDPTMSDFPVKFRAATLLLTITVMGTNSVTPTPGPLTVPTVPLQ